MIMTNVLQPILIADDDPDDRIIIEKALQESGVKIPLQFVTNGEELLNYLERKGNFSALKGEHWPSFILLDLNMPKIDGGKALALLKTDPELRRIPVIIFTTSQSSEDISRSYRLGANSFITKPVSFDEMVTLMGSLKQYWLETVQLPPLQEG